MRKKRLFIASMAPESLYNQLANVQQMLGDSWLLQPAKKLHMTILFLGSILEERAVDVIKIMEAYEKHVLRGITIEFNHFIGLPRNDCARHLALVAPSVPEELIHYRDFLQHTLSVAHIDCDHKTWLPHVTVATSQTDMNLMDTSLETDKILWHVDSLSLIQSNLTHTGSNYSVYHTIAL